MRVVKGLISRPGGSSEFRLSKAQWRIGLAAFARARSAIAWPV